MYFMHTWRPFPFFLRDILNAEVITQRAEKKPHSHPPSITQVSGDPACTYENHTFAHACLFEFSKMKHYFPFLYILSAKAEKYIMGYIWKQEG